MKWLGPVGLIPVSDGLRTGYGGIPGNVNTYLRYESAETFRVPFTWSGRVKTTKNYGPEALFLFTNEEVWYDPKLVFHPQYGTDATPTIGNNENVLIGLDDGRTSVSAELRDERPERPYGVRTGYESKKVVHPGIVFDAEWHDFRVEVLSHAHYQLWWDGQLMADVVEKEPVTIQAGWVRVGLRLDFLDVTLADLAVKEHMQTEYRIVPRTEAGLPAEVRSSSGSRRPPLANERWMTAHYTGNNIDYTGKDAAAVTRQIQSVFSKSKPFEYNYVIGQEDDDRIIEFAGKFQAAHSGGENGDSFGVLFLLGVGEEITDLMVDKWRWLRDVLVADGSLSPNVEQLQHRQMPGAATACPGASIIRRWPEFLTPYTQPLSGDILMNLGFNMIPQFRSADTREWPKAKLTPGTVYRFDTGTSVPDNAVAVTATVTTVGQEAGGFVSVATPGQPIGGTSCNNYSGDVSQGAVANTTLIPCANGTFDIMCKGGATHVVVDILGYYT
jgi:hypothetical protein